MNRKNVVLSILMFAVLLLLQACGQNDMKQNEAGSFGLAAQSIESPDTDQNKLNTLEEKKLIVVADMKEESGDKEQSLQNEQEKVDEKATVEEKVTLVEKVEVEGKGNIGKTADENIKKDPNKKNDTKSTKNELVADQELIVKEDNKPVIVERKVAEKTPDVVKSGIESIGWSQFFDGEDQTTPSDQFWDLDDSTVTIKGFMGEVLSFEKHWFLLIPQPGAECPFDNGDETYWNKIMMVFVPDDVKLRYKSEPLQITGRLDVGIKIDESGYKTMFRLYDASFKEIKE
ncbi:hypothetical protein [Paenibacillus sp. FSL K6-2524]|uniref:hypothetical protein n=1 Tax=Paenibacillus sp. FSL K6-2524 TaxID=2954516 RepID=UPI0030F7740B